jgi:hypothetical protein
MHQCLGWIIGINELYRQLLIPPILNNYFATNLVQAVTIDTTKHIPGNAQTVLMASSMVNALTSAGMR